MKKTIVITILLNIFSIFSFAHEKSSCSTALGYEGEESFSGFPPVESRIGKMGFLGVHPDVSVEALDEAGKFGAIRWEQKIYVVSDEKAAVQHSTQDNSRTDRSLYFIVGKDSASVGIADGVIDSAAPELVIIENDGSVRNLTSTETWKLLDKTVMSFHRLEAAPQLSYYSIEGWMLPEERYVITRQQVKEGVKTYGEIKKFTSRALSSGYQIVFNYNPSLATRLARKHDQKFVSQRDNSVAIGTELNNFLKLYDRSHAFTVEVYASHNETEKLYGEGGMIAGVTGHIQGRLYVIDSIFYPPNENGRRYAEAAVLALLERVFEAGIDFVDATKISYLASKYLRALKITQNDLQTRISSLPENPVVDFDSAYVSKEDGYSQ